MHVRPGRGRHQDMVTALYLSCIGMTALLAADLVQAVGGGSLGTIAIVVLPI
jgi:hypothetical protein